MEYSYSGQETTRVAETRVPYLTRVNMTPDVATKEVLYSFLGTSATSGVTSDFFLKALENLCRAFEAPQFKICFVVQKNDFAQAWRQESALQNEQPERTPKCEENWQLHSRRDQVEAEDDIVVKLQPRDSFKVMADIQYVVKATPKVVVDFLDPDENS